jgi:transposase
MKVSKSRRAGSAAQISVVHPHAAAIDIGAQFHVVAVGPERDPEPVRSFRSFTKELHDLANWLKQTGVTTVAMESTGVYWIPVFEILQARGFEVVLVNARDAKNVPGRKTDVNDAQWLQKLHSYGLLRASFRPHQDVATLRSYLRQRERLLEYAAAHIQHMQKALMQMNLQLHHVVQDVTGVTGMKIIRAIVGGERNAEELARHRDPRCKSSAETIRDALIGNYQAEHVFELTQAVALYDFYQTQVAQCDERIELALKQLQANVEPVTAPLPAARHRTKQPNSFGFDVRAALYGMLGVDLTQIHGLGPYVALKLIAECGNDMSRWPTAKHFTSWLCLAPGNKISGGKILSSKTRRSSSNVAAALRLAAATIGRTDTALGGFYRRLSARIGKAKAVTATARKIAVLFYNTLRYGMEYVDPGAAYYEERYRQRVLNNLTRRAESLGYTLQVKTVAPNPEGVS